VRVAPARLGSPPILSKRLPSADRSMLPGRAGGDQGRRRSKSAPGRNFVKKREDRGRGSTRRGKRVGMDAEAPLRPCAPSERRAPRRRGTGR
jgi:hypothetical protein